MQAHPGVTAFHTANGGSIYQLPVELFPGFWGFAYLALYKDYRVLIDTGSGFGDSNDHLSAGFRQAAELADRPLGMADLTHVLITHGHIDHFGGLNFVNANSDALLGVHELDRRIITNYEERLTVVALRLEEYLIEAGVSKHSRGDLLRMYQYTKALFRSVPVDFTYEAVGMRVGPFIIQHVPGHCAGHVVIRLHDVLFSGDHVLEGTSPHQAPERLTLSTGLEHYLQSLKSLEPLAEEIKITLGGHKKPIVDLSARLKGLSDLHAERLSNVLGLLVEPKTIAEISKELFGEVNGYNVLLALEETGAHVEYLYQRGMIEIDNLEELESNHEPVSIRYRRVAFVQREQNSTPREITRLENRNRSD